MNDSTHDVRQREDSAKKSPLFVCCECDRPTNRPAAVLALEGWYVEWFRGEVDDNLMCPVCDAEVHWTDYVSHTECGYWQYANGDLDVNPGCSFGCQTEPACHTSPWGREGGSKPWPTMRPYYRSAS